MIRRSAIAVLPVEDLNLVSKNVLSHKPDDRGSASKIGIASVVLSGILVRVLCFRLAAHGYDSYALREWTWALVQNPLRDFYALNLEVPPDHLPGDLWILYLIGKLTGWLVPSPNYYSESYIIVLKIVPTVVDVLMTVVLFAIARRIVVERLALLIALAYALNPASIVITGIWGQWDSLSLLLALAAIGSLLSGRLTASMVFLTIACLVKPQFGLLLPPMGAYWLRSIWPSGRRFSVRTMARIVRGQWRPLVVSIAAMLSTVLAVCLPFGVSISGRFTQWSIMDRVRFSLDRYNATTLGANNMWILPIGRGGPPGDDHAVIGWLTFQALGTLLLLACVGIAVWMVLNMPRPEEALVWSSTFVMMSAFLFSTRMHERYLFPVVVFSLLLCAFRMRYVLLAAGVSFAVFANVYLSLTWGWGDGNTDLPPISALDRDFVPQTLAVITIGLFLWLVVSGASAVREARTPSGSLRGYTAFARSP